MRYSIFICLLVVVWWGCVGKPKVAEKDSLSVLKTIKIEMRGDAQTYHPAGAILSVDSSGLVQFSVNTDTVSHFDSLGLKYKTVWHCDTIWIRPRHHKKHKVEPSEEVPPPNDPLLEKVYTRHWLPGFEHTEGYKEVCKMLDSVMDNLDDQIRKARLASLCKCNTSN